MKPYFNQHAAAGALFAVTIAGWMLMEVLQARKRRANTQESDRGSLGVITLCLIGTWILLGSAPSAIPGASIRHRAIGFGLGLVLTWAGVGLRWWSFKTLGPYFTFAVRTSRDQFVVSSGPYRVLRHPGYAGVELAVIGVGLTYGNWIGLVGAAALSMIGYMNRIRVEESALSATLGERYQSYARERKRMIPFIW